MLPNPQFPMGLFIFTEEILNGKLNFLSSVLCHWSLFVHPENIRKFLVFLMVSAGIERDQGYEIG